MRRKAIDVAFIAPDFSAGFVRTDEQILTRHFNVRRVLWKGKRSIFALALAVLRSDIAFSWFALDHAYGACRLARILGKKSVVVVGGVDAANRPDLAYGAFIDPVLARRVRYTVAHSDRVLVVGESLRGELVANSGVDRPEIVTINLGFDTERFTPGSSTGRNVLTVGIIDAANLRRKALDVFVEVARRMPDMPFVLVGARDNETTRQLRETAPANLRVLGRLTDEQLLDQYRGAKVYVQISRFEAFGAALGEAMACGCIPVGTQVGGIATLIDGAGFFAPVGNVDRTVDAIRTATVRGNPAIPRARIENEFSLARREAALTGIIQNVVEG